MTRKFGFFLCVIALAGRPCLAASTRADRAIRKNIAARVDKLEDGPINVGIDRLYAAATDGVVEAQAIAAVTMLEKLDPTEAEILRQGLVKRLGRRNLRVSEESLVAARKMSRQFAEIEAIFEKEVQAGSASAILARVDALFAERGVKSSTSETTPTANPDAIAANAPPSSALARPTEDEKSTLTPHQLELIELAKNFAQGDNARKLAETIRLSTNAATPELEQALRTALLAFFGAFKDWSYSSKHQKLTPIDGTYLNATRKQVAPFVEQIFTAYTALVEHDPEIAAAGAAELLQSAWSQAKIVERDADGMSVMRWSLGRLVRLSSFAKPAWAADPPAIQKIVDRASSLLADFRAKYIASPAINPTIFIMANAVSNCVYGIIVWITGANYDDYYYLTRDNAPLYYFLWDFWPWFAALVVVGWAIYQFAIPAVRRYQASPIERDLERWRSDYNNMFRELVRANATPALLSAVAEKDPKFLTELAEQIPEEQLKDFLLKLVQNNKGAWLLLTNVDRDTFRQIALRALNEPQILQAWTQDILPIIADIDPEVFVALAGQLEPENAGAALWMIISSRDGHWSLKDPKYAELFVELAKQVPAEKALPPAADINPELFYELARKIPATRIYKYLTDQGRTSLANSLRARWPEFDRIAGASAL